jgi:hypothetical protein
MMSQGLVNDNYKADKHIHKVEDKMDDDKVHVDA